MELTAEAGIVLSQQSHWWLDRCYLYVGRMGATKGIAFIVEAWLQLASSLGSSCPPLWLVGGLPNEVEGVRCAIGSDRLTPHERARRLLWWGYLDQAGVSTLLLKANVLIAHSLYEPGGRVVLEAMAQGVPVIATPHGFAHELVRNWHSGFLVPYGDVDLLRTRMEHFARQPLLRHAMAAPAQATATRAIARWSFSTSHREVYERVARRNAVHVGPQPEGPNQRQLASRRVGGVYPFEADVVEQSEATEFLRSLVGEAPVLIPMTARRRSQAWSARVGRQRWVVKHSFTAYATRPLWDRSYGGPIVDTQKARVQAEVAATELKSVVPLVGADRDRGITVRPWLSPGRLKLDSLGLALSTISAFHAAPHPWERELNVVREFLDLDWVGLEGDEDFVATLDEVNRRALEVKGIRLQPWRPISLRLGWRWLSAGLRRGWLVVPPSVRDELVRQVEIETEVALEERGRRIGICHGDLCPEHVRLGESGSLLLIDCERWQPGYFGGDFARLALSLVARTPDRSVAALQEVAARVDTSLATPRMLLSWLYWTSAYDLCRSFGLADRKASAMALAQWKRCHEHAFS